MCLRVFGLTSIVKNIKKLPFIFGLLFCELYSVTLFSPYVYTENI